MFHPKLTPVFTLIMLLSLSTIISTIQTPTAQAEPPKEPELVFNKGGIGAGLLFDGKGNMYFGTNYQLVRIQSDGTSTVLCDLSSLPVGRDYYFMSPMIWDMVIDKDNNIIAIAQDRLLKITPDGEVTTLIQENFIGFCGSSGLALDGQGNIYITNGIKIVKYTPDMKPSIFIDGNKSGIKNPSFFSIDFDPEYKYLYATDFNNQTLIRFPIQTDGTPGQPTILAQFQRSSPLNIIFGDQGNVYVSLDLASTLLKITPDGTQDLIPIKGANHIIAFGGKGFDETSIYYTTYNGRIFKVEVGEKGYQRNK